MHKRDNDESTTRTRRNLPITQQQSCWRLGVTSSLPKLDQLNDPSDHQRLCNKMSIPTISNNLLLCYPCRFEKQLTYLCLRCSKPSETVEIQWAPYSLTRGTITHLLSSYLRLRSVDRYGRQVRKSPKANEADVVDAVDILQPYGIA